MNHTTVSPEGSKALSPRKRVVFWMLLLLVPFVALTILETALRIGHYGGDLGLVVRKQIKGREYYSINRSVATRYFRHSGSVIPEPMDDVFEYQKSPRTLRIFCLGESTMAGFPYDFNATAPSFLKDRLESELTDYHIEVINVGLSAIGTHVVLDFLNELVDYEPDLFIVYAGHNEFYGAFGVGSTVGIGGHRFFTTLHVSLLKYRTYLALQDFLAWAASFFGRENISESATLMADMISSQSIPFNCDAYNEAREEYRSNISEIISVARENGIPILLSTLVSNVKDHPPFRSAFTPSTSAEQQFKWNRMVQSGDSAFAAKRPDDAITFYRAATSLDTMNASAFYKLGVALLEKKNTRDARLAFLRAKDLDVLRFRASEDFQTDLLAVCRSLNVPVARVDSVFQALSTGSLPGKELITEHLHPNIRGYFLMASSFAATVRAHTILVSNETWAKAIRPTDQELLRRSHVTRFDTLVGHIRTELLTHRWPFLTAHESYQYVPRSEAERFAYEYVMGTIPWSQARYDLAEFYARNGQFHQAREECWAVAKIARTSYEPLLRVADYFRKEGNSEAAKAAYFDCIAAEDNPYARFKLGILFLEQGNHNASAEQFEEAFKVAGESHALSLEASATGRYLLAAAYAALGRFGDARENIQRALGLNPDNRFSKDLLRQVDSLQRIPTAGNKKGKVSCGHLAFLSHRSSYLQ